MPQPIDTLVAFSQQKADIETVMRALVEHRDWHVPVLALGREFAEGLIIYASEFSVPLAPLHVFTDRASADRGVQKLGHRAMGIYASGVSGVEMFGRLRDLKDVQALAVNVANPPSEQWYVKSGAFGLCGSWSDAVALEAALDADAPDLRSRMKRAAWLVPIARSDKTIVQAEVSGQGPHAFLFSAPDRLQQFLAGLSPDQAAQCDRAVLQGEGLFALLARTTLGGVLVNASSPGARVFPLSYCRSVLDGA